MSDKTEDQIRKGLKLLAEDVQAPEGEAGRHARTWLLPRVSPRLGAALAGAAICATVGALAATGTFSGGHKAAAEDKTRVGGVMIPAILPVWVVVNRASDGTLSSVDVRVHSDTAHASIQLRVVHSDPTGGDSVVYTRQISTGASASSCPSGATGTTGPSGASGPTGSNCFNTGSSWSGTLVPSDWNGGCQSSGDYWISANGFQSETFTCDAADAGSTGKSGPTGAAESTG